MAFVPYCFAQKMSPEMEKQATVNLVISDVETDNASAESDVNAPIVSTDAVEGVEEIDVSTDTAESEDAENNNFTDEYDSWMILFPFKPDKDKDISPVDERSFSEIVKTEYWFIKDAVVNVKDDYDAKALLEKVDNWLNVYHQTEYADDILLVKADLHQRLGDNKRALITLLKHTQSYPNSLLKLVVKDKLTNLINKKFRRIKDSLFALANADGEGRVSRLARLFSGMAEQYGNEFYEPLTEEFKALIARNPIYAYRDRLIFSLAQLYCLEGHYNEAVLNYAEIIRVYPNSSITPLVHLATADIYSKQFRNYNMALAMYKQIVEKYPDSEESRSAYKELPRLLERNKKYEDAVAVYEKIIELYPDAPQARDAYRAEAAVLRYELLRYKDALNLILRMADKYKDARTVNDLYTAADIAKWNLKNLDEEIKIYDRIVSDYPNEKQAPPALLAAAQAYEKAGKTEKASEYYNKIVEKYPNTAPGKKAKKYLESAASK